jgi:23S rRNA (adenine2503-C2)-methyltransferase
MASRLHILDEARVQLEDWLSQQGLPPYRARQVRHWLYCGRAEQFSEMTDLPHSLREQLADAFAIWSSTVLQHPTAADRTEKLLLRFPPSAAIECVLLRDGLRRTVCVSTQVGCAMGCVFCASGLEGVERNLTVGEILEQVLLLQRLLSQQERLSHVVVMGMGEPLANLDSLLVALHRISSPEGLGISPRRITISTVGLPAAIDRLVERRAPYRLAISLHAANDALRDQLVPVNARIGLREVLGAADRFVVATGQRITFEYVLLAGVNDSVEQARELARLLRGRKALLNVIPYNPVAGLLYGIPSSSAVEQFCEILRRSSINVQCRERKGEAIDAACGQLRRRAIPAAQLISQPELANSPGVES